MKLYFVGTIFNVEYSIRDKIKFLISNLSTNYDLRFFIVESDSTDNTVSVLHDLQNSYACFTFISLGTLKQMFPSRIKRIAYCRNRYIEWLRDQAIRDDDKIFVVDLDEELDVRLFVKTLHEALAQNLDVTFASSSWRYYDIFALRSKGWVDESFNREISNFLNLGAGSLTEARWQFIYSKMRHIQSSASKIPVLSAFGACCMIQGYVFNGVPNLSYDLSKASEDECEHINFNYQIKNAGFHLWILPSFRSSSINKHNSKYYYFLLVAKVRRILRLIFKFITWS